MFVSPVIAGILFVSSLIVALRLDGAGFGASALSAAVVAVCGAAPALFAEGLGLDGSQWIVPVVTGGIAWLWAIRYMADVSKKMPVSPLGPPLDLSTLVLEMADRMGMEAPRVCVVSSGGALQTYAWSGCTASPVVLFSDGFLHRLNAEEQKAVVAHELGHFKTWSLWAFMICGGLSACLCTVFALWFSPFALCLLCWPMATVIHRVMSRPFEHASDAVAERYVSGAAMAGALETIENLQPFNSDWRSLPLHAIDGHPSSRVRIARLRKTPLEQSLSHTLAPWVALGLALLVLSMALLIGDEVWEILLLGLVFVGVILAPRAALKLAKTDVDRRRRRLVPTGHPETPWIFATAALTIAMVLIQAFVFGIEGVTFLVALPLLAFGYFGVRIRQRRQLRQRVAVALASKNWAEAIAVGATHPKWLSKDPIGLHDVSLAQLMGGDWQAGLDGLRTAAERSPGFLLPWLTLAGAQRWTNPGQAVASARKAVDAAPDSPDALTVLADALAQADLPLEAEEAIVAALQIGSAQRILPIAARVSLRGGDLDICRTRLDEARRVAPGDPYVTLVEADLFASSGDIDSARVSLEKAKSALALVPLHFMAPYVAQLESALLPQS